MAVSLSNSYYVLRSSVSCEPLWRAAISDEISAKRDALKLLKVPIPGEKTGPRSKQTLTPERQRVADYLKTTITALKQERTDLKPIVTVKKQQNRELQQP